MIGVINYRAGNAPSVINALNELNIPATLISTKLEIESAKAIILPGVGSAKATMDSLYELEILDTLKDKVLNQKCFFLGICIGMQVLFEHSEEGDTDCLGWLKGNVKKFSSTLRIPQIGWNKVNLNNAELTEGISNSEYFYFVNSYYVHPADESITIGKTNYGLDFCSAIKSNNIYATQFHVEKSGYVGLTVLKNFSKAAGII